MNQAPTIKIQTLNLWHHPIEYEKRTEGVAKRVLLDRPNVLCLQEVTFPPEGPNTAEIIAEHTGMEIVSIHAQPNPNRTDGVETGNAILSNLPIQTHPFRSGRELAGYPSTTYGPTGYMPLLPNPRRNISEHVIWAWLKTPSNNDLLVMSTHFSWGVFNENQRLNEAIDVNNLADSLTKDNPDALTILGVSSNATPDSDSMRFLCGKKAVEGSQNFWVDVWDHCNDPAEPGETQTPRNVWSRVMAAENGTYDTGKLPKRRIDYLYVRDWVYGQNGSPLTSRIAFSEPLGTGTRPDASVSDHYGVEGTFYDLRRN